MLPLEFNAGEKPTHDYVRDGTTNLFSALSVGTGESSVNATRPRR